MIDSRRRSSHELSRNVLKNFSNTTLRNVTVDGLEQNGDAEESNIALSDGGSSSYCENLDNVEESNSLGVTRSPYGIIPFRLISRFFDEWSHSFDMISYQFRCANPAHFTIFSKMANKQDRYMQKFLSRRNYSTIDDLKAHFCYSRQSGNYFIGPSNRGPFNPRLDRSDVQLMMSFEFNSELIIGQERYHELLGLFKRLIDFIGTDPEETPFERYLSGVEIYTSMVTTFASYRTPAMNLDLWEEREPTEQELSRYSVKERNNFRGRKFWDVKRNNNKKSKRSVIQKEKENYSMEKLYQLMWSKFIVSLMSAFLQAETANESLPWSEDFDRLYLEYKSKRLSDTDDDNCLNNKFDTFLFLKISRMQVWSDCIRSKKLQEVNEWCYSWRRVMFNSTVSNESTLLKVRSKQFNQDSKIIVKWLAKKMLTVSHKKMETCHKYIIHSGNPNQLLFPEQESSTFIKILRYVLSVFSGAHIHEGLRRR